MSQLEQGVSLGLCSRMKMQ